jgi:hypothetical protein
VILFHLDAPKVLGHGLWWNHVDIPPHVRQRASLVQFQVVNADVELLVDSFLNCHLVTRHQLAKILLEVLGCSFMMPYKLNILPVLIELLFFLSLEEVSILIVVVNQLLVFVVKRIVVVNLL